MFFPPCLIHSTDLWSIFIPSSSLSSSSSWTLYHWQSVIVSNVSKMDSFPIDETVGFITSAWEVRIQSKPAKKIFFSIRSRMNVIGRWMYERWFSPVFQNISKCSRSIAIQHLLKIHFLLQMDSLLRVRSHWRLVVVGTLSFVDLNLPIAGDKYNRDKYPAPASGASSDSIWEYLCRSVDNDYTAHPTDCKRYAYCANGKLDREKVNVQYVVGRRITREQTLDGLLLLTKRKKV